MVTGETVFKAALAGDRIAQPIYARIGHWLGIGIASLTAALDVQRIVIGGGVAAAEELLLGPTRASLHQHLFARDHRRMPGIVPATQGANAGWIGAGQLALDHITSAETR